MELVRAKQFNKPYKVTKDTLWLHEHKVSYICLTSFKKDQGL